MCISFLKPFPPCSSYRLIFSPITYETSRVLCCHAACISAGAFTTGVDTIALEQKVSKLSPCAETAYMIIRTIGGFSGSSNRSTKFDSFCIGQARVEDLAINISGFADEFDKIGHRAFRGMSSVIKSLRDFSLVDWGRQ